MCLTAHWVSNDWTMQKRILYFIPIPTCKGEMVGSRLIVFVNGELIKNFYVAVDRAYSSNVALEKLKSNLQEKKHGLVIYGEMFHMRFSP